MLAFHVLQLTKTMPLSPLENVIRVVAKYLKLVGLMIFRLVGAKQAPYFKVVGSWRLSMTSIEVWIGYQNPLTKVS
jgi:hypothetical protein